MWKAFSVLKVKSEFKPRVDNLVFRLHYKYTFMLFMAGAILSTLYDVVGQKIDCMVDTGYGPLKKVVNSYCYITGTYTVDKLHYGVVGVDMAHPGVGPHEEGVDAVTYHTYYQWVPFVLVAQGALFYFPHLLWKRCEGGMFRSIIQNLSIKDYLGDSGKQKLGNYFNRESQFEALSVYIKDYMHTHRGWAVKFVACEALNVVVTVATILFTNYFLGGEFFTYGIEVFAISEMDPENRTDPMAQVFPTMGKCNFQMFGPSGTIERRDVMCLLPTNIANEKVYILLWFWLVILGVVGTVWLLVRLISCIKFVREKVFMTRVYDIPRINSRGYQELENNLATREDVRTVLRQSDFSDYLLLEQLGDNMDTALFSEFVRYLAKYIEEQPRSSFNDSGVHDEDSEEAKMRRKEEDMLEGNHTYIN